MFKHSLLCLASHIVLARVRAQSCTGVCPTRNRLRSLASVDWSLFYWTYSDSGVAVKLPCDMWDGPASDICGGSNGIVVSVGDFNRGDHNFGYIGIVEVSIASPQSQFFINALPWLPTSYTDIPSSLATQSNVKCTATTCTATQAGPFRITHNGASVTFTCTPSQIGLCQQRVLWIKTATATVPMSLSQFSGRYYSLPPPPPAIAPSPQMSTQSCPVGACGREIVSLIGVKN